MNSEIVSERTHERISEELLEKLSKGFFGNISGEIRRNFGKTT